MPHVDLYNKKKSLVGTTLPGDRDRSCLTRFVGGREMLDDINDALRRIKSGEAAPRFLVVHRIKGQTDVEDSDFKELAITRCPSKPQATRGNIVTAHSVQEPEPAMPKTTRDLILPTAITGSYPHPLWFDVSLGGRSFKAALGDSLFREQYLDAAAAIINAQGAAGRDIVTDGDSRFDLAVGGKSWFFYSIERLGGQGL
jgi:hypothetical protein